jgi:cold-inducible RNA-binding protein
MKLFVAGLPFDMDDEELKEIFDAYGEVRSATVVLDKESGKSRGFGFVVMQNAEEGENTIKRLDGASLEGRTMSVKPAIDKPGVKK